MKKIILTVAVAIAFVGKSYTQQMYIEMDNQDELFLERLEKSVSYRGDVLYIQGSPDVSKRVLHDLASYKYREHFTLKEGKLFNNKGKLLTKKSNVWVASTPSFYIE